MFDFNTYQEFLFPFAYNILGSTDDAKDAIQDTLNTFISLQNKNIDNPKAYLIKSVINTSINKKNRQKKFVSENSSLPEPIATDTADNDLYLKDIVSYSLLILLDQLTVKERAVFVLKEAFNYSHNDIAEVLSSTPENSRKLLSRAKIKLKKPSQKNLTFTNKKTEEYLNNYSTAIRERDIKKLEQLFANDITMIADGGDKIKVLRNFTRGKQNCIQLILEVFNKFQLRQNIRYIRVNHQPAIAYFDNNILSSCQVFSINQDQKIYKISSVVDPEKLKNIAKKMR
ncbi:RNA polymerase sigma-70 factor (ECF subfamily) [Aquimarina sp. EL_43]|uniref:sigma-70 family RNA polymerase sigma factor n=1 Tax=unclassified Aquimarina TaxID=2627091 RepID=UPI0018C9FD9D|nr:MULTISPECIES: sigma-70 family RNA polymerase sigma factor [unclassified Aquimarina]MBG6131014.1 RNA polymerase sigma-70 factor (ECF subfamily) [Aquimarina sp. EL_35]MBG6151473.1 RNA polymerase sigma-70 factor (ECF subfamily) [Aquimarina sp. EL_32]MBG6169404.1 RNA polymerase sigma-70 factor (ECF subfamily) [Aquimarina sp. EL_43]